MNMLAPTHCQRQRERLPANSLQFTPLKQKYISTAATASDSTYFKMFFNLSDIVSPNQGGKDTDFFATFAVCILKKRKHSDIYI